MSGRFSLATWAQGKELSDRRRPLRAERVQDAPKYIPLGQYHLRSMTTNEGSASAKSFERPIIYPLKRGRSAELGADKNVVDVALFRGRGRVIRA